MNNTLFRFRIPSTHQPHRQTLALHLLISFVLFAAGLFCVVLFWYTGISPHFKIAVGTFGLFGLLCFLGGIAVYTLSVSAVRRERFAGLLRVLELVLLSGGSILFYLSGWEIPALLFLLLFILALAAALFEKRAPADTVIEVGENGIVRRAGLQSRQLPWRDLKQVLYRRGVLTIDCLNNRLLQYPIDTPEVETETFEAYCAAQVEKAIPQRHRDDW